MIDDLLRFLQVGVPYFAAGYLLGSIPVAWLITHLHMGADLRTMGSGNVGVMNTMLSVHRWAGVLVLLGEAAKGALAVIGPWLLTDGQHGDVRDFAVGTCALAAFIGTRWMVWLRFRGGRGNTCAGVSLTIIAPPAVLGVALLWLAARYLGAGNFSATRLALAALPVALLLSTFSGWWAVVGVAYALLFLTTHHPSTDDHMLLKRQFPSVAAFLSAPRRGSHAERAAEQHTDG